MASSNISPRVKKQVKLIWQVVSDILRTFVLSDYRLPIQSDEIEKVILRTLLSMAQAFRKHRP